ncbi:hypothetical protein F8388_014524 [Cannabis sativa]|uniref:Uncharacterized protein n=1 Tax=Cannabis sativa TaxID=3483 RepID=A0A7J6FYY2_CANSA|nr:hypothetical protein F8388_014524 [Cannabis sativa]
MMHGNRENGVDDSSQERPPADCDSTLFSINVLRLSNLPFTSMEPLDTYALRMQKTTYGKSKGLWKTLTEGIWSDAFDGLGMSLLLTWNPAIQYTVFDHLKQKKSKENLDKWDKGSSPEASSAFFNICVRCTLQECCYLSIF